jgi:hypothetical protein
MTVITAALFSPWAAEWKNRTTAKVAIQLSPCSVVAIILHFPLLC